jgi:hypothetical protein
MHTIEISQTFAANREQVFATLSDHERFLTGNGLSCSVITPGESERNGLGAVRRVDAGSMVFTELINIFDRPGAYEYRITELSGWLGRLVPVRHVQGRLEFSETAQGTQVHWMSRFEIRIPLLGWLLERILGRTLISGFGRLLESAKIDLDGQS